MLPMGRRMVDFAEPRFLGNLTKIRQEAALVLADRVDALIPQKGTPITAPKAKEEFGIDEQTVRNWAREGHIAQLTEGRPGRGGAASYDAHDIAVRVAEIAKQNMSITKGRRTDRLIQPSQD